MGGDHDVALQTPDHVLDQVLALGGLVIDHPFQVPHRRLFQLGLNASEQLHLFFDLGDATFKPQSVGAKTAKFKLVLRRGDENAFVTKDLAGIGVKAAFTLQPTSLGFGPVRVSTTSAAKYVVVRNTGESVLPLQSVKLEGDNPAQFQRFNYCPSLIAAGGKCTVRVQFKPTSVGPKSATLSVAAGGGAGMKSVALSGRGT